MFESSVRCGGCGYVEGDLQQADREACPNCGSKPRHVSLTMRDQIQFKQQFAMKVKDPARKGKQKTKIEQLVGDDLHRKSGKWYTKARVIDRENNRYLEEVIDPVSGKVIHRCEEPLSEHYGHGSAKP